VGVAVWGNVSASPHHPLPTPPPAGCGLARFRQILEVTKPRQAGVWLGREQTESGAAASRRNSRHSDEIEHGGFVGPRREADGGGAGGGERLRDLAGETKMHGRERALETADARGAIEIGLRAAP